MQKPGKASLRKRDFLKDGKQFARLTSSFPLRAGIKPFQMAALQVFEVLCLSFQSCFTPILPSSVVALSLTRH